jgi:hypothetical protein
MENQNIKEIEKHYPDEWLAFEVYEVDELKRAAKGKLLAHSTSRAAVFEVLSTHPCQRWYVTFAGQRPQKGMHVVL